MLHFNLLKIMEVTLISSRLWPLTFIFAFKLVKLSLSLDFFKKVMKGYIISRALFKSFIYKFQDRC